MNTVRSEKRIEKVSIIGFFLIALIIGISPATWIPRINALDSVLTAHADSGSLTADDTMSIGFEWNTLNGVLFQYEYPAGIFYDLDRPDASVPWGLNIHYKVPDHIYLNWFYNHATPREIEIRFYYGYAYEAYDYYPFDGELELMDANPWGPVTSPVSPVYSVQLTVGESYGAEQEGLSVGTEISASLSTSVASGIDIELVRPQGSQPAMTGKQVHDEIDEILSSADYWWNIPLLDYNWKLRKIGSVVITPYNSDYITVTSNNLIVRMAADNWYARIDDNWFNDRLEIVAIGIAKFVDDGGILPSASGYVAITFILGDNSEWNNQGNDCYLWFIGGSSGS